MSGNSQNDRNRNYKIIGTEYVTVATPGTPQNPPSNTDAVFVRVRNNNATGQVCCGTNAADVDATSTPLKGKVLNAYESKVVPVAANASEVEIDATVGGTVVECELWGRD